MGASRRSARVRSAPAAAAMLLQRWGIRISEGEMAELANTTPVLGSDPYSLGRAVDRVVRTRRLRGHAGRFEYSRAVRLACPFVALVNRPGIGGHAVLVVRMG